MKHVNSLIMSILLFKSRICWHLFLLKNRLSVIILFICNDWSLTQLEFIRHSKRHESYVLKQRVLKSGYSLTRQSRGARGLEVALVYHSNGLNSSFLLFRIVMLGQHLNWNVLTLWELLCLVICCRLRLSASAFDASKCYANVEQPELVLTRILAVSHNVFRLDPVDVVSSAIIKDFYPDNMTERYGVVALRFNVVFADFVVVDCD